MGQVVLAQLLGDAHGVEVLEQGVVRRGGQGGDLAAAPGDPAGGPLPPGQGAPGVVEAAGALGHGPGGVLLVEEGLTPLDHLPVDEPADAGVQPAVAPGAEAHVPAELLDAGLRSRNACEALRQLADRRGVLRAADGGLQALGCRRGDAVHQMSPQDVELAHGRVADRDVRIASPTGKGSVQVGSADASALHEAPVGLVAEIALAPDEALAPTDRLLEGIGLEAANRVVVDEARHRPVVGNDEARLLDGLAQGPVLGFRVELRVGCGHWAPPSALASWATMLSAQPWGTAPRSTRAPITATRAVVSPELRSS